MKEVSISGSLRENVGKRDAKKIRKEGNVPCVLYGGEEQIHFYTSDKSFKNLIYTPEIAFVNIDLGEKQVKCILKEAQFHPVTGNILHVDFQELVEGKELNMQVPVRIKGDSVGVKEGGVIQNNLRTLRIRALPKHMPEYIELDITELGIADSIKVQDVALDNFKILDPATAVVVAINVTRVSTGAALEVEEDIEGGDEEGTEGADEGGSEEASEETTE